MQVEQLIAQEDWVERSTLPAEMRPTLSYEIHNSFEAGVSADTAIQAAWRVERAHQVRLPWCSLLLGVAPPVATGERSLLIYALDRSDGAGTHLLAAWRLDPRLPSEARAAFAHIVVRYGREVRVGDARSLFFLRAPAECEPDIDSLPKRADVDLQAVDLRDHWGTQLGWAWCFAIDLTRYRRDQT